MFQNNNRLNLDLARRQTVCRLLFTSRERLGKREGGEILKIIG